MIEDDNEQHDTVMAMDNRKGAYKKVIMIPDDDETRPKDRIDKEIENISYVEPHTRTGSAERNVKVIHEEDEIMVISSSSDDGMLLAHNTTQNIQLRTSQPSAEYE